MIIAVHNKQNQRFRLLPLTRWLTRICCLVRVAVGVAVTTDVDSVGDRLSSSVKPLSEPPTHGTNSPAPARILLVVVKGSVRLKLPPLRPMPETLPPMPPMPPMPPILPLRWLPLRRQSVSDGNNTLWCVAVINALDVINGSEFIDDDAAAAADGPIGGWSQWPIWWWWLECSVTSGKPLKHDVVCCTKKGKTKKLRVRDEASKYYGLWTEEKFC